MPTKFIIFIASALLVLAIPAGLHQRSWARFFIALILAAVGIAIPLFVFVTSTYLVPGWKGGSIGGWIGCFMAGKLALTPLMLWACAAWYAVEIYQVRKESRTRSWIVLGYFHGAVVSSAC